MTQLGLGVGPGRQGLRTAAAALLPTVSLAPALAVGTRKMVAAYAGALIRATRVSDSVEQDVGFSGNDLDTATLATFLGSSAGRAILYDQSGNARHTVQATANLRPLIDGANRALVFDSGAYNQSGTTKRMLGLPSSLSQARANVTVFVVGMSPAPGVGSELFELGAPNNVQNMGSQIPSGGAPFNVMVGSDGVNLRSMTAIMPADFQIYTLCSGASARILGVGEVEESFAASTAATLTGGLIGATGYGSGVYSKRMGMKAVVVYPGTLTLSERQAVRAALRSIYGLPGPASVLTCVGDSLVEGYGAYPILGLPQRIAAGLNTGRKLYNFGVGGYTMAGVAAQAAQIDATFVSGGVLHICVGSNDFAYSTMTAAALYASLSSFCTARRSAGWKVVVSTIIDRGADAFPPNDQTTFSSRRSTFNASVRAGWTGFADGLADYDANSSLGTVGASQNTTNFLDGAHPTDAGYALMSGITAAAINGL